MIGDNRARLSRELVENYERLVGSLTRSLGSTDIAYDALHETFLRLDRVSDADTIRNPVDYIFRIALNVAKDGWRAQSRRAGTSDVDELLDIRDDMADPARIVEARSEIAAVKRALTELPARTREVLYHISVEGRTSQQVAAQLDISVRTVESDLKLALHHCADRLDYTLPRRLGGRRSRAW
ncbi:RNA polymerase sigma factor [Bradyrhizobium mercantei]|uniref:RNA polymerase sigma factor n=1 Tax=Bradyrhizobium mercantei TaxID=1904807 RepID=UPI000B5AEFD1|nr:RNA polymerase sigma factor [Bradyrhizobium mercantei]